MLIESSSQQSVLASTKRYYFRGKRMYIMWFRYLCSAALLVLTACGESPTPPTPLVDVSGTWIGRNTGNYLWGDSIRLQLTQTDTLLSGSYTVLGTSSTTGRPVSYSGRISGSYRSPAVRITLTYDPRDYGCTGAQRVCPEIYLHFHGSAADSSTLKGVLDDAREQWPARFERRP